MSKFYGVREITRNPSLLKIAPDEYFVIEDRKSHKALGLYLGTQLAEEFEAYRRKRKLLEAARKIKSAAVEENERLEGTLDDGL